MTEIIPRQRGPLIEHIRKRPALYTGSTGVVGILRMVTYLLEDTLGASAVLPVIEIDLHPHNRILMRISDPGYFWQYIPLLQQTSDDTAGISLGALVALSAEVVITVDDQAGQMILRGQGGDFEIDNLDAPEEKLGVTIDFRPDTAFFKDAAVHYEVLAKHLQQFALLNPSLYLFTADKSPEAPQRNVFHYPMGVLAEMQAHIDAFEYGAPLLSLSIDAQVGAYQYKIGIAYANAWPEKCLVKTYAGNVETQHGGSLYLGILDGIVLALRTAARTEGLAVILHRKAVLKQLSIIAAMRGKDYVFAGSRRTALGMPALRKDVKQLVCQAVLSHFAQHPDVRHGLLKLMEPRYSRWY